MKRWTAKTSFSNLAPVLGPNARVNDVQTRKTWRVLEESVGLSRLSQRVVFAHLDGEHVASRDRTWGVYFSKLMWAVTASTLSFRIVQARRNVSSPMPRQSLRSGSGTGCPIQPRRNTSLPKITCLDTQLSISPPCPVGGTRASPCPNLLDSSHPPRPLQARSQDFPRDATEQLHSCVRLAEVVSWLRYESGHLRRLNPGDPTRSRSCSVESGRGLSQY